MEEGMPPQPYKKKRIPRALREAVWIHHCGRTFERKCLTHWCKNSINAFDFQTGHDVPESKGGETTIDNLIPLCGRCNLSMGNQYTFKEWSSRFMAPSVPWWRRVLGCMSSTKITPLTKSPSRHTPPPSILTSPLAAPLCTLQSSSDSSSMSS